MDNEISNRVRSTWPDSVLAGFDSKAFNESYQDLGALGEARMRAEYVDGALKFTNIHPTDWHRAPRFWERHPILYKCRWALMWTVFICMWFLTFSGVGVILLALLIRTFSHG